MDSLKKPGNNFTDSLMNTLKVFITFFHICVFCSELNTKNILLGKKRI